jgi:hypothetical protein
VLYEWHPRKAVANLEKHGISFSEASTVFLDPFAITYPDPGHSRGEARFITFGQSAEGRLLVVSHVEVADDQIRIISARKATRREIHGYEEQE